MRGRGFGLIGNILVGIIGAVLGGLLFGAFGITASHGWGGTFLVAFIGSVVLLSLAGLLRRA